MNAALRARLIEMLAPGRNIRGRTLEGMARELKLFRRDTWGSPTGPNTRAVLDLIHELEAEGHRFETSTSSRTTRWRAERLQDRE